MKEMLHLVIVIAICAALITASGLILKGGYEKTKKYAQQNIEKTRVSITSMSEDCNRYFSGSGHTIKLISSQQQVSDFFNTGVSTHSFSENITEYISKADPELTNICPVLCKRVFIPELKRTIFIKGIGDENTSSIQEKIIFKPSTGTLIIGYEIHQNLGITPGDTITILGTTFFVQECRNEQGSREDITLGMNLKDAQRLFSENGKINEILAVGSQSPEVIQSNLKSISNGNFKVIQLQKKALALIKSRDVMKKAGNETIERENKHVAYIKNKTATYFTLITAIIILVTIIWIAFLVTREILRSHQEIAVLSSIGLPKLKIFVIFILHSTISGLSGSVIGTLAGLITGELLSTEFSFGKNDLIFSFFVIIVLPAISAVVSIFSGLKVMKPDPAVMFKSA